MSGAPGTQAPAEWYLARDGQQFGPLSDQELRKLVEGGHLRPTDLLWREGFPDWRQARILLPSAPPQAASPASPTIAQAPPPDGQTFAQPPEPATAPAPRPTHAPVQPMVGHPVAASQSAGQTAAITPSIVARPVTAPATQAAHAAQPAHGGAALAPAPPPPTVSPSMARAPSPAAARPVAAPVATSSQAPARPVAAPAGATPTAGSAPAPAVKPAPRAKPAPRREGAAPTLARARGDGEDGPRSGPLLWIKRTAVALFFLVSLAAAGWLAYPYRNKLFSAAASLTSVAAPQDVASPVVGYIGPQAETSARLVKSPLWAVLAREFPVWYQARLADVGRLVAQQKTDADIGAQMMQQVMLLRRQHAGDALSATPERLRAVAVAFADNLVRLRKVSAEACHGYISVGETSPQYLKLLADPQLAGPMQAQLTAVFEAVAEGRRVPRVYPQPKQSDYNLLVDGLAKRGWTDADLQLFSDSKAFGAAAPEKVCKLVTDWFQAQLEIGDADMQLRLLVDALKPVVAG